MRPDFRAAGLERPLWLRILPTVLVLAALIASLFLKYDCCRSQGYTHDECLYDVACNG